MNENNETPTMHKARMAVYKASAAVGIAQHRLDDAVADLAVTAAKEAMAVEEDRA